MEKLLNFNEPIDVGLLDNMVDSLYGPDPRAVWFKCSYHCLSNKKEHHKNK